MEFLQEKPHTIRYCRTHALVAELFAACPLHRSNADTWHFISRAWSDLVLLKERSEEIDARTSAMLVKLDAGGGAPKSLMDL